MSGHQPNIWGTERFLLGLLLFVILFISLWAYVYYGNGNALPEVQ